VTWTAPQVAPTDEPFTGDERAMLDGMLNYYRAAVLARCAGLDGSDLARRSLPPSTMSLLGILRHLTDVERHWFRNRFAGHQLHSAHATDADPDASFNNADGNNADTDYADLLGEQEAARDAVAALPLEHVYEHPRYGPMSLRWVYLHMIGEYAGHAAHAALLREAIDGVTFG
jgi:Protein of unknown function (DUF664)